MMNVIAATPKFLQPEEGETIRILGASIRLLTQSSDLDRLLVIEYTMPAHYAGPPVHHHKKMWEGFYVLEGELTLVLGEETRVATQGAYAFIPPETRHTFRNDSDAPLKALIWCSPGGFEEYFRRLVPMIQNGPPFDTEALDALSAEFDTYV